MYQSFSYYVILKTTKAAPSNASDLASDRASDLASVLASDLVSDFSDRMDILWEDVAASFSPHKKGCQGIWSKGADSQHVCFRFQTQYVIDWDMLNLLQLFCGCQNLRHGLGTAAKCCFRACGKTPFKTVAPTTSHRQQYEVLRIKYEKMWKNIAVMGFGSGFFLSKLRFGKHRAGFPSLIFTWQMLRSNQHLLAQLWLCGCKGLQLPGAFIHDQCGFELIIHTLVEFSKMVTEPKNHGWNICPSPSLKFETSCPN